MQTIARKLDDLREKGQLTDAAAAAMIRSDANGRDAWGHELLFRRRRAATGTDYVLLSLGSDGRRDLSDINQYFSAREAYVQGEPERDIVFGMVSR